MGLFWISGASLNQNFVQWWVYLWVVSCIWSFLLLYCCGVTVFGENFRILVNLHISFGRPLAYIEILGQISLTCYHPLQRLRCNNASMPVLTRQFSLWICWQNFGVKNMYNQIQTSHIIESSPVANKCFSHFCWMCFTNSWHIYLCFRKKFHN